MAAALIAVAEANAGDWSVNGAQDCIKLLSDAESVPYKVSLRRIEKAVDKGFLEFGTNIRFCWLTSEGKMALSEWERVNA